VLARARANHFKKTGDLDRHGKVDVTKSEIMRLRAQELVNRTTVIRDLGTAAVSEAGAEGRGVTAARVAALTVALGSFSSVMSSPRGQIVNRSALLKEVETDIAALLELVNDMDDLVVQFDGSDDGRRFIEAWKHALIIVDTGGGHSVTPPTPQLPRLRWRTEFDLTSASCLRKRCMRSGHAGPGAIKADSLTPQVAGGF
jgi:hypothetical protein